MRWLIVAGFAVAACAHGPTRAMHPGFTPAADPTWHGHVPMPGDLAIAHLLTWATRHPDAAQQIEAPALEWTAEHHGC
jgi:hypothetical protein